MTTRTEFPEPLLRLCRGMGIDRRAGERAGLAAQMDAMAAACAACADTRRCRAELQATDAATVPAFCPNAGRLALAEGYLHRWCIAE